MPSGIIDDLSGLTFGRLKVICRHEKTKWNCICTCGNTKAIRGYDLKNGKSLSCGCLHRERTIAAVSTHGLRKSSEYGSWSNMIQRCTNPNDNFFKDYGARGISVCDRWLESFEKFLKDMGKKPSASHSLDRYPDVNGNYEPGNCRWATLSQQARNKRNSHIVEALGRSMPLADWVDDTGIKWHTILARINRGWTPERALSTAVAPWNR